LIRCNNAGEISQPLEKWCSENLGGYIFLEHTAPYTPAHNGIVERRFAMDGTRAHTSMILQAWKQEFIDQMWCEATYTALKLTISMTGPEQPVIPFKLIFGRKDQSIHHKRLKLFGTIVEVKLPLRRLKSHKKSQPMVMIGNADDHASDCYKFYSPVTKKLVRSRYVSTWYTPDDARRMKMPFYDWKRLPTRMPTVKPVKKMLPSGRMDEVDVHQTSDEEDDDNSSDDFVRITYEDGQPDQDMISVNDGVTPDYEPSDNKDDEHIE
jgi:hypothetical protein